jgi:hypothetical protein
VSLSRGGRDFSLAQLVGRISQDMPLESGDVVAREKSVRVSSITPWSEIGVSIDGIDFFLNRFG